MMEKSLQKKNIAVIILFSAVIGGIIAAIVWGFLWLLGIITEVFWDKIPSLFGNPLLYPLFLCLIGGILIGLLQKRYGPCPEELSEVMAKYKKDGTYDYGHIPRMLLVAFLPLIFGAAIGPEAGLTGVIVGLCCWARDNFAFAHRSVPELGDIGIAATLAVLFGSPLFGFVMPIEEDIYSQKEIKLPKKVKTFAIVCAIIGGMVVIMILRALLGSGTGLPQFEHCSIGKAELLWLVPLILCGILGGWIFNGSSKLLAKVLKPLQKYPVALAIGCGLILGIVALVLPDALFSGEAQMESLMENYLSYSPGLLCLIAVVKFILINICLACGWRGGNFFPAIFAAVCIGFCCAEIMGIDAVFCCAVTSAAVITTLLRKPLAAALLLMLCFPLDCLIWLLIAAFLTSLVPDIFKGKKNEVL